MDGLPSVDSMDGAAVGDPVMSGKHGRQKQSQWHTSLIQTKGAGTPDLDSSSKMHGPSPEIRITIGTRKVLSFEFR